jgi:hypothetical protein
VSDGGWHQLVREFIERRIDERAFHDGFFELWHAAQRNSLRIPAQIETLFYVVEAYCPDPALRDPKSVYEADDAELRQAAEKTLAGLPAPSRLMTFLNRMKP